MVIHLFTFKLEEALRADRPAIRRDGVATLALIMRQEGPPSDRALATLWLYHLANHDSDAKVRAMAAVPIRLTAVWSDELEGKLYSPEYEVRLDATYTLGTILDSGSDRHAATAKQWLDAMADSDPHPVVRDKAAQIAGRPARQAPSPKDPIPFLKRTASFGATQHDMMTVLIAYAGMGVLFLIFMFGESLFGTGIIGVFPMGLGGLYCLFARSGI